MSDQIHFASNYQDKSTAKDFQFEFHFDRCQSSYKTKQILTKLSLMKTYFIYLQLSSLCLCLMAPALAQQPSFSANEQLQIAIGSNKIEDIKKALGMKDLNINAKNNEGETPLFDAVRANFSLLSPDSSSDPVEIVKLLIDHGADVNVTSKDGYTPLFILCSESCTLNSEQSVRVAKMLIEKRAAINFNRVDNGFNEGTPLGEAIKNAKVDLVKFLVERGANVNSKGNNDDNPLIILLNVSDEKMTAASKLKLVQILIAKGANPSQENDRGESAYSIAKENDAKDVTDALHGKVIAVKEEKKTVLEVGGIKFEAGANGQLAYACAVGNLEDLKNAIANGGEVNTVVYKDRGWTPLQILCNLITLKEMREQGKVTGTIGDLIAERMKMINYIIEKGAKVNFPDGSHSPLYIIVVNGILSERDKELTTEDYLPIVKLLLDKGAIPDMIDSSPMVGDSPLNYAASMGALELVKLMLPKVKNINKRTEITPLAAMIYGNGRPDEPEAPRMMADRLEILKLMIAKGANVNQVSGIDTPLSLAGKMKKKYLVKELIKAGAK